MKKSLLCFLVFSIWYLVFGVSPALAVCMKDPSQIATGNNLGCNSPLTCQRLTFPAANGPLCNDPTASDCWCASNDPNYIPPAVNLPPLPAAQTGLPTSNNFYPTTASGNSCSTGSIATDSRPNECATCTQTNQLAPSCATTFSANDEVKFRTSRADFMCASGGPEQAWIKESWGGVANISFNDEKTGEPLTKIPFVGKKGAENEQQYLADYFEGTQYYKPQLDLSTCTICQTDPQSQDCQTCQQKLQDIILTAGVWRKLAPEQLQDDFKRKMIERAKTGNIHDYQVEYNGESARLTEFNGHLPPKANDPTYSSWQKSKWGKLWPAVPMFSREDTPGTISLRMGQIPSPPGEDKFEPLTTLPIIEKVPHVARLYEVTQALQKLLVPFTLLSSSGLTRGSSVSDTNLDSRFRGNDTESVVLGESANECFNVTQEVVADPVSGGADISVTLHLCSPPGGGDGHVRVWVDGNETITNDAWNSKNGTNCYTVVPERSGGWVFVPYGGSLPQRNYEIQIDRCHGNFATQNLSLCASLDKNGQVTNKCGPLTTPAPTPLPVCGLPGPRSVPACKPQDALVDSGGDKLCCDGASMKISATDTFVNTFYPDYQKGYGDCMNNCLRLPGMIEAKCDNRCDPEKSKSVSREISVSLNHPYLNQIWEQTTDSLTGFLNIFNISGKAFEDLPAATKVGYKFTPNGSSNNTADPQIGDFYFPHLGGIQEAKEFVINLLNPSGGGVNPTPTPTPTPSGTTLDYVIPYHDATLVISSTTKAAIIAKVKSSWPSSQIEENWDKVFGQAVSNGFNPAFVLALWIEESGANGVTNAWGLGCGVHSDVAKDIDSQLTCLFNVKYANDTFQNFMCQYSEGQNYPCTFTTNPNFPGNLKSWYDQLIAP